LTRSGGRSLTAFLLWTGGALLIAVWLIYTKSVIPLQARKQATQSQVAEVRQTLAAARATMQEVAAQQQEVARVRSALDQLHRDRRGPAVVWFPERIKAHFQRFGLPQAVTRLNTALDEPELPGYQRIYWAVEVPIPETAKDLKGVLRAVGTMESAEATVRVIDLAIRSEPEKARQVAVINISVLVRE